LLFWLEFFSQALFFNTFEWARRLLKNIISRKKDNYYNLIFLRISNEQKIEAWSRKKPFVKIKIFVSSRQCWTMFDHPYPIVKPFYYIQYLIFHQNIFSPRNCNAICGLFPIFFFDMEIWKSNMSDLYFILHVLLKQKIDQSFQSVCGQAGCISD